MRCEEVQSFLGFSEAPELPTEFREHLTRCTDCREYAEGWRQLRSGFRTMAQEEAPAASIGFVGRLARRLQETAEEVRFGTEFLERIGRRFVYATLALTLAMAIFAGMSSWSPLRATAMSEMGLLQPELASLESDPVFTEASDIIQGPPLTVPAEGEQKQR